MALVEMAEWWAVSARKEREGRGNVHYSLIYIPNRRTMVILRRRANTISSEKKLLIHE